MARACTGVPKNGHIAALADFRSTIRRFLEFSEQAALRVGLQPQQHQLLLQVAGAPEGTAVTVSYVAERLRLRHHSVVELSKRCEEAGLLERTPDPANRRKVLLWPTTEGVELLRQLSEDHRRELDDLGPELIQALGSLAGNGR